MVETERVDAGAAVDIGRRAANLDKIVAAIGDDVITCVAENDIGVVIADESVREDGALPKPLDLCHRLRVAEAVIADRLCDQVGDNGLRRGRRIEADAVIAFAAVEAVDAGAAAHQVVPGAA